MGRPKNITIALSSLDACGGTMKQLLLATLRREALEVAREQRRAEAGQVFDPQVGAAVEEEKALTAQLQQYYLTHLAEVESDGKRRSVQLTYGTMGRRLTPPALKPRNKSFSWAAIRALLRTLADSDRFFHAPKEADVNKDAVKKLTPEELAKVGLKLEQDEEFFVDLDRTVNVQ